MKLLIKNGLVVDPKNNLEKICDVLVEDGKIKGVGENIDPVGEETEVIELRGLWSLRGSWIFTCISEIRATNIKRI